MKYILTSIALLLIGSVMGQIRNKRSMGPDTVKAIIQIYSQEHNVSAVTVYWIKGWVILADRESMTPLTPGIHIVNEADLVIREWGYLGMDRRRKVSADLVLSYKQVN